jgi:ribonuclease PH
MGGHSGKAGRLIHGDGLAAGAPLAFTPRMTRPDGRQHDELRPISFIPNVAAHATGSVLVSFGDTRVICSATIEEDVPRWMRAQKVEGGWLTAEYSMLPYSTLDRKPRDISRGKLDGRSSEIQRLIGRALRAVVDLKKIGQRTVWIDCDVLQADGGTRTASITGGCVAMAIAFNKLFAEGKLKDFPIKKLVAAVSAGVYQGVPVLDLNYPEDKDASVDFNVVMTETLDFVEVQGSGEEAVFSSDEMSAMLELSRKGVSEIVSKQKAAILTADRAAPADLASLAAAFGGKV